MNRYSRERMPPARYLAESYYERWLFGLEKLLVEQGLAAATELESGHAKSRWGGTRALGVSGVAAYLSDRLKARLADDVPPKFKPGDHVVARNIHPVGHTRLPRYARGRRGLVDRDHGVFTFADTNAMSRDKKPQHLYGVRFAARELWGPDAPERDSVYVLLWDDHLDAA